MYLVKFNLGGPLQSSHSLSKILRYSILVALFYYFCDYLQVSRRQNHIMVERGVRVVPTLHNRVVIFSCDEQLKK